MAGSSDALMITMWNKIPSMDNLPPVQVCGVASVVLQLCLRLAASTFHQLFVRLTFAVV